MKLLLGFFNIFDHIADTLEFFGLFIGNLNAKFLLQSHYQLDGVERVCAQILNKLGFRCDLIRFYAELLDNDIFYPLVNWFVCHIIPAFLADDGYRRQVRNPKFSARESSFCPEHFTLPGIYITIPPSTVNT
ncbi:MAG TPA: hypothetical protein VNX46_18835 [Candidatus Acidoferrum sp.]|nr:hypothetical protein [Candidatus Acidoferrum sp.]